MRERDAAEDEVLAPGRVKKPWGDELVCAHTDEYAGKVLYLRAGETLSLQFHEERDKTLFLLRGSIVLEIGAGVNSLESIPLSEGQGFRISAGILHGVVAVTEADILEISTPELDDIVQVHDGHDQPDATSEGSR